jgi:hypothetical protein
VKILVSLLLLFSPVISYSQIFTEETLLSRLKPDGTIGEVLSKRSAVIHSHTFTAKEIATTHENLVRTGIVAIAYFKTDAVLAGRVPARSWAVFFV